MINIQKYERLVGELIGIHGSNACQNKILKRQEFFFSGIEADFGLREEEDEELSEELFREECSLFFSDAL